MPSGGFGFGGPVHLKGVAGVGPVLSRHPKYAVGNRNSQGFLICLMSGGKIPCRRVKTLRVGSHFSFAQLTASIGLIPGCCNCMSGSLGGDFGGCNCPHCFAAWGLPGVLLPVLRGADYYAILGIPRNADQAVLLGHCCTSEIGKTKSCVYTLGRLRLRSSSSCLSRCGASNSPAKDGKLPGFPSPKPTLMAEYCSVARGIAMLLSLSFQSSSALGRQADLDREASGVGRVGLGFGCWLFRTLWTGSYQEGLSRQILGVPSGQVRR